MYFRKELLRISAVVTGVFNDDTRDQLLLVNTFCPSVEFDCDLLDEWMRLLS